MTATKIQKIAHVSTAYNRKPRIGRTAKQTPTPKIQLTGNWLKNVGFEIGQTLTIIATGGIITIKKNN
jgi:hypothetical protein